MNKNDERIYSQEELSLIIKDLINKNVDLFIREKMFFILPEENRQIPNASDINNGFCYSFADKMVVDLSKLGIQGVYAERIMKDTNDVVEHAFFKVGNLFYDSETPEGVSEWEYLPVFKNAIEASKNKHESSEEENESFDLSYLSEKEKLNQKEEFSFTKKLKSFF